MRQALRVLKAGHLSIDVLDGPGHGGASHDYRVLFPNQGPLYVSFQNGGIREVGVNGVTHEALIAIVIDRLEGFQAGDFPCRENADAIIDLKRALEVLNKRTAERVARGVEGTLEK